MKYDTGTGYQRQAGWIGVNDGLLVLDRNFSNSVENGTDLWSSPLAIDWGITAIDYANSRYEFNSLSGNNGVDRGSIFTQTLEAQKESVLYTPVQGGMRIDFTNGAPEVVVTQVQSEAAVYTELAPQAAGETIALSEDGTSGAYNPNTQDGPIAITAAQLLGNDTWLIQNSFEPSKMVPGFDSGACKSRLRKSNLPLHPDGTPSERLFAQCISMPIFSRFHVIGFNPNFRKSLQRITGPAAHPIESNVRQLSSCCTSDGWTTSLPITSSKWGVYA